MEDAPLAEIKPNVNKAFTRNLLIAVFIFVLMISLLIYLDNIVGLDVFTDAFEQLGEFGIKFSPSTLLYRSIFILLFFTALSLVLNYATLGKLRYTLYPDKIVYDQSLFIMQLKDKTISFANIAKISCEKKSFLNTSKIVLDLTGTKKSKLEMDFIDDAEEVVKRLQALVRDYRAKYYAQYSQDYHYQNIMDQT